MIVHYKIDVLFHDISSTSRLDGMSHQGRTDRIVVDGPERIMSGPTYKATAQRLRYRMNRRCRPLLGNASLIGKLLIRLRIRRFVRRRLEKLAPPGALYASKALSPVTPTSNQSLQLTAGRSDASLSL